MPGNTRNVRKELRALGNRHVQNVGNVFAFIFDFQRLAVIAFPTANLAGYVHVGQEVHLDLDGAIALARLTAPALHVE